MCGSKDSKSGAAGPCRAESCPKPSPMSPKPFRSRVSGPCPPDIYSGMFGPNPDSLGRRGGARHPRPSRAARQVNCNSWTWCRTAGLAQALDPQPGRRLAEDVEVLLGVCGKANRVVRTRVSPRSAGGGL